MDWRTAELAMREGLQYADAIEQSHCRQMIATTTALLDWGRGTGMPPTTEPARSWSIEAVLEV